MTLSLPSRAATEIFLSQEPPERAGGDEQLSCCSAPSSSCSLRAGSVLRFCRKKNHRRGMLYTTQNTTRIKLVSSSLFLFHSSQDCGMRLTSARAFCEACRITPAIKPSPSAVIARFRACAAASRAEFCCMRCGIQRRGGRLDVMLHARHQKAQIRRETLRG